MSTTSLEITLQNGTLITEWEILVGMPGRAGRMTIGSVTTGEPGSEASVSNSGTAQDAVLDFTIPRGAPGPSVMLMTPEDYEDLSPEEQLDESKIYALVSEL